MDSITDPVNRTTQYGALTSITDPKNQTTTFNRDIQSRVYQRVFQDNTTIDYLYEGQTAPNTAGATSRLQSSTDAKSQRTNYAYFVDDNIQQVSYTTTGGHPLSPPTPSVSFGYDPNYNRLSSMADGIGTTNYSYYPVTSPPPLGAGQLKDVDGPLNNDTITYSYDELGRTVGQSINGVASNVGYDSLGRLATSDNALGQFRRDYVGVTPRLQTLTYANGQMANYSYFDNSRDRRLQTLQNLAAGDVNLSKFDYIPDAEGQISTWTKQLGTTAPALTGAYGYDLADQLKTATMATVAPPVNYSYGYDFGGNRTSDQLPPGTHTFNDVNETQDPGYTYDANGNLTADGINTYFWDAANRLVAIQKTVTVPAPIAATIISPPPTPGPISTVPPTTLPPPSTPAPVSTTVTRSEFSYDGLGRRVRIVNKQGTGNPITVWTTLSDNQYLWRGSTLAEERDSSGWLVTKRFFAEGEQRVGASDAGNYYYTRDHLGSVREMTDSTGAVHAQYEYDPFGVRTKLSGDLDADFGFTGYWHHGPSGLNLALYRAYSPTLGRWLSRDPIGEDGGLNLYGYVENNPLNNVDLLGLKTGFFATSAEAAIAGARADLQAASGGRLARGAIEFGGWVCKSKCGGAKPFYYTGPTRGHKGPTPDGRNVSTYSNPGDFEKCTPGDDYIGIHYAHPDGTGIPVDDPKAGPYPLMLARPTGGQFPAIKLDTHGSWP
jgi:RHS repeat-associated protein